MREMKDSGVEWIGKIPKDWLLERGKYIFLQRNQRGNKDNLQLLSPTQKYGVIPQLLYDELSGMNAVKLNEKVDLSLMKTIHNGDYCISLRSFQGGFEYSKYEGVVSPAYQVFYPQIMISDGYYKYLFKDSSFIEKMNSFTMSLRDGKNIAYSDFSNSYIPYPPVSIQKSIADLLDSRCSEIDSLSADIQKQIDILNQYKQSVITEAVTRGLDKNVEMKDSGVEWIGKIPKGWSLVKITYLLDNRHTYAIGDGDHGLIKSEDYIDEGIPYIRVQNLGWCSELSMDNVVYISPENNRKIESSTLHPNDVLFAKTGATIGKTGIVPSSIPIANTTSHVGKITVAPSINPQYIYFVISSYIVYKQFWDIASLKSTRPELSIDEIKSTRLIVPNTRIEQDTIVSYLESKCLEIDLTIELKQSQIDKLSEYKKSLIYEFVTGKKEVPNAE